MTDERSATGPSGVERHAITIGRAAFLGLMAGALSADRFRGVLPLPSTSAIESRSLDEWTGTTPTPDDSQRIGAAMRAAHIGGFALRATPGRVYRGHGIDPSGTTVDWRRATLMVPDNVIAQNMFVPTGAFRTIGGTFDGNRSRSVDGGSDSASCAIYMHNSKGWSGQVRMEAAPVFREFWRYGPRFLTSTSTNGVSPNIKDALESPLSAVYLERPEVYNCGRSGIYALAVNGLHVESPHVHHNAWNGVAWTLCRGPEVSNIRAEFNGIHGAVSQYSTDDVFGGAANDNGRGGFVVGGGSDVLVQGRGFRAGSLVALRNGRQSGFGGVIFDPTKSGAPGVAVPVHGRAKQIFASDNGGSGVQVTCAEYLDLGAVTANHNGGSGITLSGKNVTYSVARCQGNSGHGISEFGSTAQYGENHHGHYYLAGNGDGLSMPYLAPGDRLPSTFRTPTPELPGTVGAGN